MRRERAKKKCGLPDVTKPWEMCGFHGANLRRHHRQVHQKKQNLKSTDIRVAGSGFAPGEAFAHLCPGSQVSECYMLASKCMHCMIQTEELFVI